jgi:hypothetical protein
MIASDPSASGSSLSDRPSSSKVLDRREARPVTIRDPFASDSSDTEDLDDNPTVRNDLAYNNIQ